MNTRMAPGLSLRLQQRQKMAQQVQLSLRLLPLNQSQLQRYLSQQLRSNPALGWRTGSLPAAAGSATTSAHDIALATHVGTATLHEHLLQQLYQHPASDELKLLAEIIIDALDEDGYLTQPLATLRAEQQTQQALHAIPLRHWQQALQLVQALEPAGVAASDLSECLRLQLQLEPDSPQRQLAWHLINDDLQQLAAADVAELATQQHSDPATVTQALQLIRSLEPKPGRPYAAAADLVQADAEITQAADSQLQVRLLQPASEQLELLSTARASAAQRQAARQLLQALQLREQNLYNIISTAAALQADMLIAQDQTLTRPLTQAELATRLGLHPSTVSRAVRTRHVLWRGQLMPLRHLFSRAVDTADGDSVATTAIKAALQQLVDADSPEQPASDQQLQHRLAELGYPIARRTVAKYRQQLGIAPAHRRRKRR